MATYFISGHREVYPETKLLYFDRITKVLGTDPSARFVVGDYYGVDQAAQSYLSDIRDEGTNVDVTVYHMLGTPRANVGGFPTVGGFKTDHERDLAMTLASDFDIAFVEAGREGSGTHQNIIRRGVLSAVQGMSKRAAQEFIKSLRGLVV